MPQLWVVQPGIPTTRQTPSGVSATRTEGRFQSAIAQTFLYRWFVVERESESVFGPMREVHPMGLVARRAAVAGRPPRVAHRLNALLRTAMRSYGRWLWGYIYTLDRVEMHRLFFRHSGDRRCSFLVRSKRENGPWLWLAAWIDGSIFGDRPQLFESGPFAVDKARTPRIIFSNPHDVGPG